MARFCKHALGLASSTQAVLSWLFDGLIVLSFFTGGSLAIVVVRYRGIWGFFELRGWIVAGRFALALFVVADCVTLFCVCRGFRKTQKDNKSITCKQWSFMIWSVSTCQVCT